MLGRTAFVIWSGHGLQSYWPVEDDGSDLTASKKTLRRFKGLVDRVAADHDGHVDSLFDLARVFRVPGSRNMKDLAVPKTVTVQQRCDDIDRPSLG